MPREGTRTIAALATAVLAAGLLSACGSSDSESGSTSASTPTEAPSKTSTEAAAPAGQGGASQNSQDGKPQAKSGGGSQKKSSGSSGGDVTPAPLKVSGGGSEQFQTKGGDNSIQEFGDEAEESELQQAAEAVHGFYVARADEDWAKACSYMAKSNVEQLEQLGAQSPQFKGKGCAPILQAFTRPLPASVRRETTVVDAGSLRLEGERAFLIYNGPENAVYAMPLVQEDGEWKVAALAGSAIG